MIVKWGKKLLHKTHLIVVFNRGRQYNMELNPNKCILRVKTNKLLIVYLI